MIYLGIDAGTQSTKTLAFDGDTRRVLASATATYDLIPNLPPGHKEQDPQVWLDAVGTTVRGILWEIEAHPFRVQGIWVSGQTHGFVSPLLQNSLFLPAHILYTHTT